MTPETAPQSGNGNGNIRSMLLIFLSGLAAGATLVFLVHESKAKNPGKSIVKNDSIPAVVTPTPLAVNTNSTAPAERERPAASVARPKNLGDLQGAIDVNGFPQMAASEAVAVSYQEYLQITSSWAQSHPNNQSSCTWGGRIHKDALNRIIGSLSDDNPWVRFKFGAANNESRTFIMFTGKLNSQGGSVIYRNGGDQGTFCPIQCD